MKYKVIVDGLTLNGEELKKGDVFEATPSEVISFSVKGWIEESEETPEEKKQGNTKKKV